MYQKYAEFVERNFLNNPRPPETISALGKYLDLPDHTIQKKSKNSNVNKINIANNPNCLLLAKKNQKISRNERCPVTEKKFKHCCGAL